VKRNRFFRNIALGIENLWLHKLRSFLTMLGMVFGVGSVVAMLSVGEGAGKQALEEIAKLGSHNVMVTSVRPADEETGVTVHLNMYGLTYADHDRMRRSFAEIREIAPVKLIRKEARLNDRALELRIVGTTDAWFRLVPRPLLAGRVLTRADESGKRAVAVLTEFGARKLLATRNTLGQTVRIGSDAFEVVGILRNESGQAGSMQVPDDDADVYIPLGVAREYFGDYFVRRSAGSFIRERVELHQIIARAEDSFRKILRPVKQPGTRPALIRAGNVYEQADFVAQRIMELIDEGTDPSGIAVLYRSHYHSMEVQMELARREIPFTVRSGVRFFEQAHIKDVLSYLKVIDNPRDEIAWKRILVRLPRIGPRTAEKIWSVLSGLPAPLAALERVPVPSGAREGWQGFCRTIGEMRDLSPRAPDGLIGVVLEGDYDDYLKQRFPNYERRREDLIQLARYAARYDDLEGYLDELAMIGGLVAEDIEPGVRREMVVLSTVHQAKGLEWDAVFIIWLAEGKFPAAASYSDAAALEEERRLFYVAATRCRRELYLLYPLTQRGRSGLETIQKPSRFLTGLDRKCYEIWDLYDI